MKRIIVIVVALASMAFTTENYETESLLCSRIWLTTNTDMQIKYGPDHSYTLSVVGASRGEPSATGTWTIDKGGKLHIFMYGFETVASIVEITPKSLVLRNGNSLVQYVVKQ